MYTNKWLKCNVYWKQNLSIATHTNYTGYFLMIEGKYKLITTPFKMSVNWMQNFTAVGTF